MKQEAHLWSTVTDSEWLPLRRGEEVLKVQTILMLAAHWGHLGFYKILLPGSLLADYDLRYRLLSRFLNFTLLNIFLKYTLLPVSSARKTPHSRFYLLEPHILFPDSRLSVLGGFSFFTSWRQPFVFLCLLMACLDTALKSIRN